MSFPRRRESRVFKYLKLFKLDSRLRGNDIMGGIQQNHLLFFTKVRGLTVNVNDMLGVFRKALYFYHEVRVENKGTVYLFFYGLSFFQRVFIK